MHVIIPSIGESEYLPGLLAALIREDDVGSVVVVDNSPMESPLQRAAERALSPGDTFSDIYDAVRTGFIHIVRIPGQSIYKTWNMGMDRAHELGTACVILNDDIILSPGSLKVAEDILVASCWTEPPLMLVGLEHLSTGPLSGVREVTGTFRTGGFGGFAFAVNPARCPRVDERFRWWYGDDDLAERIKAVGGRMVVARGARVQHPKPSTSGNRHPWTAVAAAEDAVLFKELWPDAS